jgi:hypothetical protein
MKFLKASFDWICLACFAFCVFSILGMTLSVVIMLLHWAFTSNPRGFALGFATVLTIGLGIRGLYIMKLE